VVWVEDWAQRPHGARRSGFGYATLPGHPECGEESFTAVLETDGSVFFELHAYSRHANWFYRAGGLVARSCQELVTRRYLRTARQLAAGGEQWDAWELGRSSGPASQMNSASPPVSADPPALP
jgi:hypothetical protein